MMNVNIRDSVYQAIEEYNNTVKKPHCQKFTDSEKNGMFYTILRRYIPAFVTSSRERGKGISVDTFNCTFKENGELRTFKIKKEFNLNSWISNYHENIKVLECVKEIGNTRKEFYTTPAMNEIADIVNQIK